MRLHTNGSTTILLCGQTRFTWRKSGKKAIERLPVGNAISNTPRSGLLCITPSGERDLSARLNAAGAITADAIDEENVIAILEDNDTLYVVRGSVTTNVVWQNATDIGSVIPNRVDWPAGLIWDKNDPSMYTMADHHGTGIPQNVVPAIESNRFGTAIASAENGTVIVLRPGSPDLNFSLQIPSQEGAALYACPTADGVLVTIIIDPRTAANLHIAENGTVLGHRQIHGAIPAICLNAGFLIHDEAGAGLQLVDSALNTKAELKLPSPVLDSAAAIDETSFALAGTDTVVLGHVDAASNLVILTTLGYDPQASQKSLGEIAAIDAKWDPSRSHGKTAIGFATGKTQQAWQATLGTEFVLKIQARSTGGAGKGISITMSGDAVKHCEFNTVEMDGITVNLEQSDPGQYTAEFPDAQLSSGIEVPLSPKPKNDAQKHAAMLLMSETQLELTLRGKAHTASNDLLSISISAMHSSSPPLKWMRPFTIS